MDVGPLFVCFLGNSSNNSLQSRYFYAIPLIRIELKREQSLNITQVENAGLELNLLSLSSKIFDFVPFFTMSLAVLSITDLTWEER